MIFQMVSLVLDVIAGLVPEPACCAWPCRRSAFPSTSRWGDSSLP